MPSNQSEVEAGRTAVVQLLVDDGADRQLAEILARIELSDYFVHTDGAWFRYRSGQYGPTHYAELAQLLSGLLPAGAAKPSKPLITNREAAQQQKKDDGARAEMIRKVAGSF